MTCFAFKIGVETLRLQKLHSRGQSSRRNQKNTAKKKNTANIHRHIGMKFMLNWKVSSCAEREYN